MSSVNGILASFFNVLTSTSSSASSSIELLPSLSWSSFFFEKAISFNFSITGSVAKRASNPRNASFSASSKPPFL
uniref:Uncharacterized protein n=1 Tax=Panstrongylus lignarius TaxID=156445 RepID=A0A224Y5V8_9HEMI